jgi:hypothetical protein
MPKKLILFVCCVLPFFASCERLKKQVKLFGSEIPVVEINGETLYRSDIEQVLPQGLSAEDSAMFVDNYIKKWVIRNLMYEKASKNVDNSEEIDRLVSDYRRSLVIHRYQQELIQQKMEEPSEKQIKEYYDNNSAKFQLKENLVKGLYIKLPKAATKIDELKLRIADQTPENLQEIEKYCYQHAVNYEYFGNNWVALADLMKKIPFKEQDAAVIVRQKLATVENDDYIYILAINDFNETGSIEPYDFAKDKVRIILMNANKNTYMATFEEDLYERAKRKGDIKVYNE